MTADGTEGHRELRAAARDVAGVCPGMFLLGIGFGLVVVHHGLAWWWAPLFSGLIFAGSLEFLLVALVTAGTSLAAIAITTILVNGRHVFYALSFPLERVSGRVRRAYSMFALIDEAYALTASRPDEPFTSARILAGQALMHASWVSGGVSGALVGAHITVRLPALDFVFVSLFVVLAVEACIANRDRLDPAVAVLCAVLARLVAPGQMLLVAMGLYMCCLAGRRRLNGRTSHALQ